jgi:hypothetical protein
LNNLQEKKKTLQATIRTTETVLEKKIDKKNNNIDKKKEKTVTNNKRQGNQRNNRRISKMSNPDTKSDDTYVQNGPKKVTKRISPNDINNESPKNSSFPDTKNHTYAEAVTMEKTTSTLATTTTTMHKTLLNIITTVQTLLEKNNMQNETDDLLEQQTRINGNEKKK